MGAILPNMRRHPPWYGRLAEISVVDPCEDEELEARDHDHNPRPIESIEEGRDQCWGVRV